MSLFSTLSSIFVGPHQQQKSQKSAKNEPVKPPQKFKDQRPLKQIPVEPIRPGHLAGPTRGAHPLPPAPPTPPHVQHDDTSLRESQARAREIIVEAKDEALRLREKAEGEVRQLRQEISEKERSIDQKLSSLDQRLKALDSRDEELQKHRGELEKQEKGLEELKQSLVKKLEQAAGLSREQAKQQILENLEKKLDKEMATLIQTRENVAKEEADEKAKEILVDAMRHGATEYVTEYTVSVVKLPDEEVKGRIIGKDGRNIRAFEQATGVDIDLDDQPGQVRLSSFDPVRREIARITLEQLIKDGRIQPTRIEETVQKVTTELKKIMFEEGKRLCYAVGVYNLPSDLIQVLGRFKYRFSYGQNLIAHTLEETKIGAALAKEVGANVETVKLGCLLHDIGKVVEGEEGSHVEIGVNLLKKYNIPQVIIDCVEQHHEDVHFTSKESILVYIADAISGARPGARYENYEEYVKRLTKLEDIAKSYAQVKEAYAIQAGREVRVILNPEKSNDDDTVVLSHTIKERVEKEMTYPGTVTVTVVREIRASDVAK